VSALEDVQVQVHRGEIYAFLGLNGAGKSTTIRLLLGMMRPTSGFVDVFRVRVGPGSESLWKRVGVAGRADAIPSSLRGCHDGVRR
jgi:ABC-2 type transport system ATP-binding protein